MNRIIVPFFSIMCLCTMLYAQDAESGTPDEQISIELQSSDSSQISTYGESVADSLPPAAVDSIVAIDRPNDAGGTIELFWTLSRDDVLGYGRVAGYEVLRSPEPTGPFDILANLGPGTDRFVDTHAVTGMPYYYIIRTIAEDGRESDSSVSVMVRSSGQWFDIQYIPVLIAIVILLGFLALTHTLPLMDEIWAFPSLRRTMEVINRPQQGPILFVPGTGSLSSMSTIASLTFLEQVMRLVEERDGTVLVYVADPLAFAASSELIDVEGNHELIYVCPDPAVFSAAFTGEALRKGPQTIILAGEMNDEALLLAEAGSRSGAYQVAGTNEVQQTPFLLSTCELTLIGEDLFQAGPQLSMGGYRAATFLHDRLKVLIWVLIMVGILAAKLGWTWFIDFFSPGGG